MELDVTIERIDNGYIVSGKGATSGKRYYKDLETFARLLILEDICEKDRQIREHKMPDKPFHFKITTDL
ncbi:MAG: hypothetical protein OEM38_04095 [Gammaproteobacteria bacterium]|nr:hypothetical protein [Gammaproteobacteria bacterium]